MLALAVKVQSACIAGLALPWLLVGACLRDYLYFQNEFASSALPPSHVCMSNIEHQHSEDAQVTLAYYKEENTTENEKHWYIPKHRLFLLMFWHQIYLLDILTYVFCWSTWLYTLSFHNLILKFNNMMWIFSLLIMVYHNICFNASLLCLPKLYA